MAMEIAQWKITDMDYNTAKFLAKRAQTLFPELNGLKQLLVMIEVYISGEKKTSGESDWYGILGVDPLASDVKIKKRYRELAMMLHPDKNKFQGAQGAFCLLSEAWNLLKDSDKRKSYDQKRIPPPSITFWTKCDKCMTLHEYKRCYLNRHLRCHTCRGPFIAVESLESATFWTQYCDYCQRHYEHKRSYVKKLLLCPTFNGSLEAVKNVVPQAQDRGKRGFEVLGESQERDTADLRDLKRLKTDDSHVSGPFSGECECSNQTGGTSSTPTKGDTETPDTIAP